MTDKIMMDGEPLEVGDEVYSLKHGIGKITNIDTGLRYSIYAYFVSVDTIHTFDSYFKFQIPDETRDLYWQKPEITPPPKPKKNVKVWDWFVEFENEIIARTNGKQPGFFEYRENIKTIQKIDGTEREVEI